MGISAGPAETDASQVEIARHQTEEKSCCINSLQSAFKSITAVGVILLKRQIKLCVISIAVNRVCVYKLNGRGGANTGRRKGGRGLSTVVPRRKCHLLTITNCLLQQKTFCSTDIITKQDDVWHTRATAKQVGGLKTLACFTE